MCSRIAGIQYQSTPQAKVEAPYLEARTLQNPRQEPHFLDGLCQECAFVDLISQCTLGQCQRFVPLVGLCMTLLLTLRCVGISMFSRRWVGSLDDFDIAHHKNTASGCIALSSCHLLFFFATYFAGWETLSNAHAGLIPGLLLWTIGSWSQVIDLDFKAGLVQMILQLSRCCMKQCPCNSCANSEHSTALPSAVSAVHQAQYERERRDLWPYDLCLPKLNLARNGFARVRLGLRFRSWMSKLFQWLCAVIAGIDGRFDENVCRARPLFGFLPPLVRWMGEATQTLCGTDLYRGFDVSIKNDSENRTRVPQFSSDGSDATHSMAKKCLTCGAEEVTDSLDKKLLQCSRCHKAKYCSVDCQKQDWKRHKDEV
eukprot:1685116-Rhodomonas_salina.5